MRAAHVLVDLHVVGAPVSRIGDEVVSPAFQRIGEAWARGSAEVVVFEAADYAGGHTHTHDVELDSERHAIDSGFIVFNDATYPHFVALLADLGVASQATDMSFSVRWGQTGLEYAGSGLNGLFAQRRNLFRPQFRQLIRD